MIDSLVARNGSIFLGVIGGGIYDSNIRLRAANISSSVDLFTFTITNNSPVVRKSVAIVLIRIIINIRFSKFVADGTLVSTGVGAVGALKFI